MFEPISGQVVQLPAQDLSDRRFRKRLDKARVFRSLVSRGSVISHLVVPVEKKVMKFTINERRRRPVKNDDHLGARVVDLVFEFERRAAG
jgi:hypothetical protein